MAINKEIRSADTVTFIPGPSTAPTDPYMQQCNVPELSKNCIGKCICLCNYCLTFHISIGFREVAEKLESRRPELELSSGILLTSFDARIFLITFAKEGCSSIRLLLYRRATALLKNLHI